MTMVFISAKNNTMSTFTTKAYGASGALIAGKHLNLMEVERNAPENDEVKIEVLYCGVCHSDVHQVANDWKNTVYPCVPGHEIIGRVVSVGDNVTMAKPGDIVGVGCMIDSCQHCEACIEGDEQFCQGEQGPLMTYNGYFRPSTISDPANTFGGYSTHIVANQNFLINIPESLDISKVAPILCAGVTTYSPLNHWDVQEGDVVGIVGIGGLGHMAVKLAKAMGAKVIAITTKEEKREAALALGADEVLISEDKASMKAYELSMNYILVTIPYPFDINPYICLLKWRGAITTVGLLGPYKQSTDNMEVAKYARTIGGSLIGGIAETQEVIDFCAENNILPDVEMISIQDINKAFEKIKDEEVRFRYVIDMKSLKEEKA